MEPNAIDKQRRSAFVYACIALFIADVALWFLGVDTYGSLCHELIHPIHFTMTLSLFVLYLRGKLPVVLGITILSIANQLSILFEMWVCFTGDAPLQTNLIMGYIVMAGLNMTLVLMAYIRVLPFVLGALVMTAYGVCCLVSRDALLTGMLPVFLACFAVISLLGHQLSRNVHRLEHEKSVLKDDEQKVMGLFDLDRSQLLAYISLAKEKGISSEQTGALLDLVGKKARENIMVNVSHYSRQQEIDYANLHARLPMLTPSEIEICSLV